MADKEPSKIEPDFTDDSFWSEFNQKLWLLLSGSSQALPEADSHKQNCLSIARCQELAEKLAALTMAEKAHLEGCRYCVRQIKAFSKSLPADPPMIDVPTRGAGRESMIQNLHVPGAIIESRPWLNASLTRSLLAVVIIIAVVTGVFFVFRSRLFRKNEIASDHNETLPGPMNSISPNSGSGNTTSPDFNVNNSGLRPKTPENNSNRKPAAADKTAERPNPNEFLASEPDLKSLLMEDRKAVLESARIDEIWLAGSDLEKLTRKPTRSVQNDKVSPLSPRNEATLETNPVFSWQGPADTEYRIIVTYLGNERAGESDVLSQNNGQVREKLEPGVYYWRIAVRSQGEKEKIVTGFNIFKILSEEEKRRLTAAVNATQGHVVRAILYARAGLLANAESELNAELIKNPNSSTARKMLGQVQGLRRR